MNDQQPSDDLIARVIAGEATQREIAAVEAWAAAAPGRRDLLERIQQLWQPSARSQEWDVDLAWQRVSAQVESGDHELEIIPIPRAPAWTTTAWRIAALLLVVVGVAFAWRALGDGAIEYAAAPGEVLQITLADGTAVALAPGSRLAVPDRFDRSTAVTLEGEAWFDVAPGSSGRFTVHAGPYVVRDLGTAFALRRRHADSLGVVVEEGVVLVDRGVGPGDTLAAGAVAVYASNRRISVDQAGDVGALTGWRDGSLEFTAVPAARVAARLGEWYGVRIRFSDGAVADRSITVTMPGDSLDEALDVLALLLDVTIERGDGTIVLR